METVPILLLALLQGLTEFLPISSSAHLILAPYLFRFPDQGLAFDVAVHVGTLAAVLGYFRRELAQIIADMFSLRQWRSTASARLGWLIVVGTLPLGLAGLMFKETVETAFRSPLIIAGASIFFGLLLWYSDLHSQRQRDEFSLRWRDALIVGVFQALALIPGTSRSGGTMTAGLLLGLTRKASSRFSFLLSIPAILLSGGLVAYDLIRTGERVDWRAMSLGAALSFVTAYFCIHYFLRFIERIGMWPFVLYRLILGVAILVVAIA